LSRFMYGQVVMPTIYGLDNIKEAFPYAVITLGNFDGVHLGHQALFTELFKRATANKGKAVVITFYPHPLVVLKPEIAPEVITPIPIRTELILRYGIDFVLVIPFDQDFARMRAPDFVKQVLLARLGMKELLIGYDFAFGYQREGNIALLQDMSKELDFTLHVLNVVRAGDTTVSSTNLRNLLHEGNVQKLQNLLGRPFQVRGKIVEGRKVGGPLLGFPTANLDTSEMGIVPAKGVYAVEAIWKNQVYPAVCNVGVNPTFGLEKLSVEVHIFDFDQAIYGEILHINFIKRIREERKFTSIEELAAQIRMDAKEARLILNLS
jgi:riboflavin kinase / FMN adenylyltransferase